MKLFDKSMDTEFWAHLITVVTSAQYKSVKLWTNETKSQEPLPEIDVV